MRSLAGVALLLAVGCECALCPNGAIDYGQTGQCVQAFAASVPVVLADSTCKSLGGRLLQVYSSEENLVGVLAALDADPALQAVTIGVSLKDNATRTYADGSPLNYANFASNDEYSRQGDCTLLNVTDFKWYAQDCNARNAFVCEFSDHSNQNCAPGWYFNDKTYQCYYIQNVLSQGPALSYSATAAELMCQGLGGHLVSIHSDMEDIFLRNLLAASRSDELCHDWQALIGASCSQVRGKTWTDGTPYNFDLTAGTCNDAYAMINDDHCPSNLQNSWDDWPATMTFSRFICKKQAN